MDADPLTPGLSGSIPVTNKIHESVGQLLDTIFASGELGFETIDEYSRARLIHYTAGVQMLRADAKATSNTDTEIRAQKVELHETMKGRPAVEFTVASGDLDIAAQQRIFKTSHAAAKFAIDTLNSAGDAEVIAAGSEAWHWMDNFLRGG